MQKIKEKEKAINLRKKGLSYSEILKEVPVAKSTLSRWLRSVGLSKYQKQRLTKKKILGQQKAWKANIRKRIEKTERIKNLAKKEIDALSHKELWLVGIMLYWAEGCKEKSYRTGEQVALMNTDPNILKIFKIWLLDCCKVDPRDLVYDMYIHKSAKNNLEKVERYWRKQLNIPSSVSFRIYFKKHNPKTVRKNINENYYGTARIKVNASTDFNRKIAGWMEGVYNNINF